MSLIKTPFKDAAGLDSVPHKGTAGGKYGSETGEGMPGRDGGDIPELNRDTHVGSPKTSGPFKSPFKDAVS